LGGCTKGTTYTKHEQAKRKVKTKGWESKEKKGKQIIIQNRTKKKELDTGGEKRFGCREETSRKVLRGKHKVEKKFPVFVRHPVRREESKEQSHIESERGLAKKQLMKEKRKKKTIGKSKRAGKKAGN